ncbi:MAG: hypothetical protein JRH11_25695 [Deltaproteobacteria bacterium]|nr:hypothetical protein [Deltaproteobacteria bacterium]
MAAPACNPGGAEILGNWARPEVHLVDEQGAATTAPDWRAELWLPDDSHEDGCRFSCASHILSAVALAEGPATFVRLTRPTNGAHPLRMSGATLSVSGAAPLSQTEMRTDRFVPYEGNVHQQSYLFAYPPTNPPTWDYLEATIGIEGSQNRLRVRFVRGESDGTMGGASPPSTAVVLIPGNRVVITSPWRDTDTGTTV